VTGRPRVLVLARAYPNDLFPTLGLWVEQPTLRLAEHFELRVVSPVPYCPPLPNVGPLREYVRFRTIAREEVRNGVEVVRPRLAVGPGSTTYAVEAASYNRSVAKAVDRLHAVFPFELIHAHFIYPDGVAASRLARRYGVPFVVTEHAPWTGWLDRPGIARQAVPAALAASRIMAVSTSVERTIRDFAGGSASVQVVPVGVDGERFRLGAGPRVPDQILFVGFVNRNKGVDVLLRALKLLQQRQVPGRAVLVGGSFFRDTRIQEEELRRLAHDLDLDGRVRFAGRLPQDDVARLMAESAVVVLPSRAESFGAVLVEALACGTPVVATRCGGPEDIVRDGVGRLVPVGDAEALADELSRVLAHPELYEAKRLREYALGRFGWDAIADEVRDVYLEAIG
jgi:teichuronic acid biosynthesis glycosyltransferase TuaC